MGEAVDRSLSRLTPGDVAALVAYLKTVPAIASSDLPAAKATAASTSHKEGLAAGYDLRGKQIFEGACASCHSWSGVSLVMTTATLTGARAVNDSTATNVVEIVLEGTKRTAPGGSGFMPAFGAAYSDAEIAAVANYVSARFGGTPSHVSARDVARMRREN